MRIEMPVVVESEGMNLVLAFILFFSQNQYCSPVEIALNAAVLRSAFRPTQPINTKRNLYNLRARRQPNETSRDQKINSGRFKRKLFLERCSLFLYIFYR